MTISRPSATACLVFSMSTSLIPISRSSMAASRAPKARLARPVAGTRLRAPAIGEDERIEQVSDRHLGAVLEGRGEHAIGDFRRSDRPLADVLEHAAARLGAERIGRHLDAAGLADRPRHLGLNAVGHPTRIEREWDHRRIANRRPHQPTGGIGESGNRVPSGSRWIAHAKVQLAVPRIVLELDRTDEERRIEPAERVEGDVLDAGRIGIVEVFPPRHIAHHHAPAPAR